MIGRILLYAVLGVLFAFVANVIYMLDINKRIFSHRPGPCRYVEGIGAYYFYLSFVRIPFYNWKNDNSPICLEDGAEDIEIIYSKGIAFVSSGVYYLKQREGIKGWRADCLVNRLAFCRRDLSYRFESNWRQENGEETENRRQSWSGNVL